MIDCGLTTACNGRAWRAADAECSATETKWLETVLGFVLIAVNRFVGRRSTKLLYRALRAESPVGMSALKGHYRPNVM